MFVFPLSQKDVNIVLGDRVCKESPSRHQKNQLMVVGIVIYNLIIPSIAILGGVNDYIRVDIDSSRGDSNSKKLFTAMRKVE